MRGPGLRVLCDIRRMWECPRCGYIRRAGAAATVMRCHCSKDEPLMKLVEGQRRARKIAQPLDLSWEYVPDPEEEARDAAAKAAKAAASMSVADVLPVEAVRPVESVLPIAIAAPLEDMAELEDDLLEEDASTPTEQNPGTSTPIVAGTATATGPARKKKRRKRKPRPPGGESATP